MPSVSAMRHRQMRSGSLRDDVEAIRAVDGIEGVNVSDSFSGETTTGKGNFLSYADG